MIFGNKNSFAIEIEFNENYGGEWLFGKICYWIEAKQYGRYEEGTTLRDVLPLMKYIISDKGNRNGEKLCQLSSSEAYFLLNNFFYGDDETENATNLPETPARFEVTIPIDVLLGPHLYLIHCNGEDRLLYQKTDEINVNVLNMANGVFDNVMKQVFNYLDEMHELERDKSRNEN